MSNLPLREDEQILVEVRRELEQAWLEQMPSYFFRLTSETEKVIWLNSLLIYRYTGAAVALRKDNMLYQVGEVAPQNLVRNLEKIQDEDILGGVIYRSQNPLWEGGEIVEFSRFELWQREDGEQLLRVFGNRFACIGVHSFFLSVLVGYYGLDCCHLR